MSDVEVMSIEEILEEVARAKERSHKSSKTEPLATNTLLPLLEQLAMYVAENEPIWLEGSGSSGGAFTPDGAMGGMLSLSLISEIRSYFKQKALDLTLQDPSSEESIMVRTLFFALESELQQRDLEEVAKDYEAELIAKLKELGYTEDGAEASSAPTDDSVHAAEESKGEAA